MMSQLAQTDQALEDLLQQLTELKSVTEQLRDASETAGTALQVAEQISQLSRRVISDSQKQLHATVELSSTTTQWLDGALASQEALAHYTRRFFESDLRPQLEERLDKIVHAQSQFSTETRSFLAEDFLPKMENGLESVLAAQAATAADIRRFLDGELRPQLTQYQRVARMNRWLLVLLLVLVLANFGFCVWFAWLR